MSGKYDDIIDLPAPEPRTRPRMPREERAAQFSPFAALTGYEDVIEEAARLTAERIELSEDAKLELNEKLNRLAALTDAPGTPVQVELTWFEPDGCKLGGAYVTEKVTVRRVDRTYRCLELEDRSLIEIDRIFSLREAPAAP